MRGSRRSRASPSANHMSTCAPPPFRMPGSCSPSRLATLATHASSFWRTDGCRRCCTWSSRAGARTADAPLFVPHEPETGLVMPSHVNVDPIAPSTREPAVTTAGSLHVRPGDEPTGPVRKPGRGQVAGRRIAKRCRPPRDLARAACVFRGLPLRALTIARVARGAGRGQTPPCASTTGPRPGPARHVLFDHCTDVDPRPLSSWRGVAWRGLAWRARLQLLPWRARSPR